MAVSSYFSGSYREARYRFLAVAASPAVYRRTSTQLVAELRGRSLQLMSPCSAQTRQRPSSY